jgi:molecular chaperone DnaK
VPQIEVTFDIDANGILNVSARDLASGKQQQITITASSGLTKDEVERLVREAEAHAAEDARRREEIELRNQADALVYSTERSLAEHGAKLAPNEREAIDRALAEAREALRSDDSERIRRAHDNLTRAAQTLAQAMSRDAGAGGGEPTAGGPRPGAAPSEGEVVDAEFEDTDERRKAS